MNKTKHDLSYDSTKLDYIAMLRTSEIAFAQTRNQLDRYLHDTHSIEPALHYSHLARLIAEEADKLVVVAETMDTLRGGLKRNDLEVVNKPVVEDKE